MTPSRRALALYADRRVLMILPLLSYRIGCGMTGVPSPSGLIGRVVAGAEPFVLHGLIIRRFVIERNL